MKNPCAPDPTWFVFNRPHRRRKLELVAVCRSLEEARTRLYEEDRPTAFIFGTREELQTESEAPR